MKFATKRSKACEFSRETRERIAERDGGCVFCQIYFKLPPHPMRATDIMHIIPRSQGGLGIEQNGVLGCRWHHEMMDNGYKGERPSMIAYLKEYMKRNYPDWDESKVTYKKGATR